MNINEKVINEIIEEIFKNSEIVANLKGGDFERACKIGDLRLKFWKKHTEFTQLNYASAIELKKILLNNESKQRIKKINSKLTFEYGVSSFYHSIIEDLKTPYISIHDKESIDKILNKYPPLQLTYEKAAILSQHQDVKTLRYLFNKLHNLPEYNQFLKYVYGECIFRKPKVLEDKLVIEFFKEHIKNEWENFLSPTLCELETFSVGHLIQYGRSFDGGYGWNGEILEFNNAKNSIKFDDFSKNVTKLHPCKIKKEILEVLFEAFQLSSEDLLTSSFTSLNFESGNLITSLLKNYKKKLYIESDLKIINMPINKVYTVLLNAASGYNCTYCKQGNLLKSRLLAWKLITSLAGLDIKKGNLALIEPLKKCKWFAIEPKTDWFYQVMSDIWLVCINEEQNLITMLCATGTD